MTVYQQVYIGALVRDEIERRKALYDTFMNSPSMSLYEEAKFQMKVIQELQSFLDDNNIRRG